MYTCGINDVECNEIYATLFPLKERFVGAKLIDDKVLRSTVTREIPNGMHAIDRERCSFSRP